MHFLMASSLLAISTTTGACLWQLAVSGNVRQLPQEASNNRLMSLTTTTCKMIERIIRDEIGEHLYCNAQHDFLSGRSKNLLSALNTECTRLIDDTDDGNMYFLEFNKAFDVVNH